MLLININILFLNSLFSVLMLSVSLVTGMASGL